ncbi:MAG: hypothetical protein Q9227_007418 [Pyrenula ochraceoflavens]
MQRRSAADQNNLANWDNRARVWFHEVTHQVYLMNTPKKGPNVIDLTISYREAGQTVQDRAYGPMNAKRLRNYTMRNKGGYYTQINGTLPFNNVQGVEYLIFPSYLADNYAFLALAKYVQGIIGHYPNAPSPGTLGLTAPPRDPDGQPLNIYEGDPPALPDPIGEYRAVTDPEDTIGGPYLPNPEGYKIPGCPDVHPIAAGLSAASTTSTSTSSSSSSSSTSSTTTITVPPTTTTTETPTTTTSTPSCTVT